MESGYDKLYLFEGNSSATNSLATLSGYTIPNGIVACSNQMHVRFTSDGSVTKAGFHANIHAADINNDQLGEMCYCTDEQPCGIGQGHCVSDDQCSGDLLCGSDNCVPELGFANGTNCCFDGCSMVHMTTNESGILHSPFYPDFYRSNLDCSDQIIAEEGKIITIEFESFNVSPCLSILGFKLMNIILHCFLGFRWKVGGIFFICVMATVQLEMLWKL